jgi:hypothetical protein
VRTIVRLYLGWRLLRLIRPLAAAGMIAGVVLALHVGHAHVNSAAARTLQNGATAASQNLPEALRRAFEPGRGQP